MAGDRYFLVGLAKPSLGYGRFLLWNSHGASSFL